MNSRVTPRTKFILLIVLAFFVDYLPVLRLPFLWSETFFHELSHGIMALLTGGSIQSISLDYNGAGLCIYTGGIRSLVSFSGYAGSGIWGLLIYISVGYKTHYNPGYVAYFIILIILTVLVFWASKISTLFILIVLVSMYLGLLLKKQKSVLRLLIQFVGVFVMLDAIRSPLYLLGGSNIGDAAQLSQLTWIPEIIWVATWLVISGACLVLAWRYTKRHREDAVVVAK